MKIKRLEIDQFGKFENQNYVLSPTLNIFIGDNGTGKTTLMEFIHQVLFEFPKKNQKEINYQTLPGKEIGGRLIVDLHDNTRATISRQSGPGARTGKLEVSLNNGKQISEPERKLNEWLHQLNQKELRQLYTFNLSDLQTLKDLQKEDLNEYFQSLTTEGSQKVYQQLNSLQKEAAELYKKTGQNPVLNQKFTEYEKVKRHTEEAARKNEQIIQLMEEKRKLKEEFEQLLTQIENNEKAAKEIKFLLTEGEKVKEIHKLKTQKHRDLPKNFNRSVYQKWQEQMNQINQLEKLRIELEQELSDEFVDSVEIVKEFNEDKELWNIYLSKHNQADYLAEKIEKTAESVKNMEEQFKFFLPQSLSFDNESIQDIALPDPLDEPQIQEYLQISNKLQETERKLKNISKKRERLNQEQTMVTSSHLVHLSNNLPASAESKSTYKGASAIYSGLLIASVLLFGAYFLAPSQNIFFVIGSAISALAGIWGLTINKKQEASNNKNITQFKEELIRIEQALDQLDQEATVLNNELIDLSNQRKSILKDAGWPLNEYTPETLLKENERYRKLQQLQFNIFECQVEIDEYMKELKNLQQPLESLNHLWASDPMKKQKLIHDYLKEVETYQSAEANKNNKQADLKWRLQKVTQEYNQAIKHLETKFGNLDSQSDLMEKRYKNYLENEQLDMQIKSIRNSLKVPETEMPSLQELEKEKISNEATEESLKEKSKTVQRRLFDKLSEINYLMESGAYEDALQDQANFEAELGAIVDEWISLQMAMYLLRTTLKKNMESVFNNIQLNINKYFRFLTDNYYHQVNWDGDELQVINRLGEYYTLEQLSSGTSEQLYFAIRLAFIDETSLHFEFPLIIDDAFVNFDQKRKIKAYKLIEEFSRKHQVIYFTFDADVVDYVREANIHTLQS